MAHVEQMDFIVDGPLEDLVGSVVPAAVEVDRLSLNDVIKVSATTEILPVVCACRHATSLLQSEMPRTRVCVLTCVDVRVCV